MFVCCLCVFFCFSLMIRESAAAANLNCSTRNMKTPGSPSRRLMLVMVSSVASDIFEWNNNHTQIRTVLSFTCLKKTTKIKKQMHVPAFLRFFLLCRVHAAFFLYISPKNRPRELCPKECVYPSLPTNTPTHALMHAHARTPTVYIPFDSSLQAILSAPVGHTPSAPPRRGTFGSSFQWQKKKKKKTNK